MSILETEAHKEKKPEYKYAFSVIADNNGNLSVRPIDKDHPITTEQLHEACSKLVRNIEAQDIATTVVMKISELAQEAQKSTDLLVPSNLRRVK